MKAVFQTKISPAYDDIPENFYHFPRTYLRQVREAVGDWIVYYEPRRATADALSRGGRQAYFAMARVVSLREDIARPDHFYADVTDYLDFDNAVPFKQGDFFYEAAMKGADGRTNSGSAQRAVRNMPDDEFDNIVRAGFAKDLSKPVTWDRDRPYGFAEEQMPFGAERPLVETTITRPFRDAAFARQVQATYDRRCAMTGLRIINGGGRPEAQAAHIKPVAAHGPDSIRNGLALSSTFHWMFDRGLLSIDDDFKILTVKNSVPPEVGRLLNPSGLLAVPEDERFQPHREFLRYHRDNIFKG
ncbi:MAG: restriction endonuclease [Hyphomicrobium sp. 32-62-53]|nr:MAG: restriction endonuclease [Hyphomicrobium sp. 12-62-95]OYY00042.1 MAG: restriction endonuclease [Hyphomicrobium sp. 32-62-53]